MVNVPQDNNNEKNNNNQLEFLEIWFPTVPFTSEIEPNPG